jgi:hypothetical protein
MWSYLEHRPQADYLYCWMEGDEWKVIQNTSLSDVEMAHLLCAYAAKLLANIRKK